MYYFVINFSTRTRKKVNNFYYYIFYYKYTSIKIVKFIDMKKNLQWIIQH